MNEKKYRLRNGVVVTPVDNYGAVHVVDTQNAVFVAIEEYTVRDVTEAWAVGNVRQLSVGDPNPLSWEGDAWGEQFDVIAEVVEATPTPRDVEGKLYVRVDAEGLGCSGCAFCVDDCCKLVVEYKLLPQCKGESDSIWREVTE